nr:hypothetical protein [Micromonospora sp. RTP1Z1]
MAQALVECDRYGRRLPQPPQPGDVVGGQRLLERGDVEVGQAAGHPQGGVDDVPLVGVHPQRGIRRRLPDRSHHGHVLGRVRGRRPRAGSTHPRSRPTGDTLVVRDSTGPAPQLPASG